MDSAWKEEITSILEDACDMTIATVRVDGYPQATTVSYVNDGLNIYFGCAAGRSEALSATASPSRCCRPVYCYPSWPTLFISTAGWQRRRSGYSYRSWYSCR